jgi:hypothetical protein
MNEKVNFVVQKKNQIVVPCLSLSNIDFSASTDALFPTNKRFAKSFL